MTENFRECRRCSETFPLSSFTARADNGKPASYCLDCRNAFSRESTERLSERGTKKKCGDCKLWLPLADFNTGGKQPTKRCVACLYQAVLDGHIRKSFVVDGHKMCLGCFDLKALTEFRANTRGLAGVVSYCLPCYAERHKMYYEKDTEKYKAQSYRWREENPERYRAQHRLHQYKRKWQEEAQADGTVTEEFLIELYAREICYYCGNPILKKNRTLEHKVPLSVGGVHGISNIEMACSRCNCSKRSTSEEEFKERLFNARNSP